MQEVPREEFKGKEVLVGPILRISCREVIEFLKPVTIQLPVSLGNDQLDTPDVSKCRVRVLFLRSEDKQKEWVEITEDVKNSTSFDGKTVRFQVQRFSKYERSSVLYYNLWSGLSFNNFKDHPITFERGSTREVKAGANVAGGNRKFVLLLTSTN